ncbi:hypothetical protein BpHYR1_016754 [Brachionus plicatilis]|uniref:Uncharacterized protein n=1 Tax=Brachionus plicatilis TaxID=10195 RepID=A0A3M7Q182_BRAPC|nr:hypothetical protein BpHYR1_016754 [Brachionus plicatilis]
MSKNAYSMLRNSKRGWLMDGYSFQSDNVQINQQPDSIDLFISIHLHYLPQNSKKGATNPSSGFKILKTEEEL